jgi:hypothetical protein
MATICIPYVSYIYLDHTEGLNKKMAKYVKDKAIDYPYSNLSINNSLTPAK